MYFSGDGPWCWASPRPRLVSRVPPGVPLPTVPDGPLPLTSPFVRSPRPAPATPGGSSRAPRTRSGRTGSRARALRTSSPPPSTHGSTTGPGPRSKAAAMRTSLSVPDPPLPRTRTRFTAFSLFFFWPSSESRHRVSHAHPSALWVACLAHPTHPASSHRLPPPPDTLPVPSTSSISGTSR